MNSMELIHADNLTPDQIMLGDLIKIGEDIVEVIFIESDSTGDNYDIQTENEFGEKEIVQLRNELGQADGNAITTFLSSLEPEEK